MVAVCVHEGNLEVTNETPYTEEKGHNVNGDTALVCAGDDADDAADSHDNDYVQLSEANVLNVHNLFHLHKIAGKEHDAPKALGFLITLAQTPVCLGISEIGEKPANENENDTGEHSIAQYGNHLQNFFSFAVNNHIHCMQDLQLNLINSGIRDC